MPKIQIKRGTRAQLDTAKSAAGLRAGELYHITDESRIAIGSGASSYIALVKESEGGFAGVAAPTNLLPKPGAIGLTNVRLVGSIYYSTEGKAHAATKVQISSSATFGTLAFEATKGAVTGVRISAADIASDASYYWRMAYQDMSGAWSDWSVPTAFAVGTMVGLPEGGTITTDGAYTIHTFTSSGTFELPYDQTVDVLVVAGGGGGGSYGGGGGGGGVIYQAAQALAAGSYAVTVGGGGTGAARYGTATNGSNSKFGGIADAIGGGGGGSYTGGAAKSGGSGGGAVGVGGASQAGGAGAAMQGFAGGASDVYTPGGGGGGSGIGGKGTTAQAGHGGVGFSCSISPAATHYGGGGGAGAQVGHGAAFGLGGLGGGGNGGGADGLSVAVSGVVNTGGGGGGGGIVYTGTIYKDGGSGGSGIVIVRYLTA